MRWEKLRWEMRLSAACEVCSVKGELRSLEHKVSLGVALQRSRAHIMFLDDISATGSHKARTHGPECDTAHASSMDEKGLLVWPWGNFRTASYGDCWYVLHMYITLGNMNIYMCICMQCMDWFHALHTLHALHSITYSTLASLGYITYITWTCTWTFTFTVLSTCFGCIWGTHALHTTWSYIPLHYIALRCIEYMLFPLPVHSIALLQIRSDEIGVNYTSLHYMCMYMYSMWQVHAFFHTMYCVYIRVWVCLCVCVCVFTSISLSV